MYRKNMKGKGGQTIHKKFGVAVAAFLVLVGVAFFAYPQVLHAQDVTLLSSPGNWIVLQIGYVLQWAVSLIGNLLLAIINILIQITQYNGFGESDAVNIGWVVVRDLANMLFIVSLVVISFGTVLQWEQYRYNRLLGKLALTVILVNFSKSIALFFIDFSQVIMMTFVNAFKNVAAGNLITGFGLNAMLAYAKSSTSVDISLSQTVMIYALAIILLIIATIVTLTLVVVFARRVISLWILIILSPIAWIASVMPGGVGRFNSDWWSKFGKELFVGPTLAFFLWLSFSIIFLTSGQGTKSTADIIKLQETGNDEFIGQTIRESASNNPEIQAVVSEIGSTRNMFNFIITIALLIHSMSVAREAGGFAGKFAGSMSGKIDQGGKAILNGLKKAPGKLAGATGVSGVASRAGFGFGDKALGVLKNMPIIGGAARTAQSNLRQRRYYKEDKDKRNFQYMSNQDLNKFGGGLLATEKQRSNYKNAIETKIERGLDLSEKDLKFYQNSVGYRRKIKRGPAGPGGAPGPVTGFDEDADDRYSFSKFTEYRKKHLKAFGATLPAGGAARTPEEEAAQRELEKELKGYTPADFKKLNKDLQDPAVAQAVNDEINARIARLTTATPTPASRRQATRFRDELLRDGTDALNHVITTGGTAYTPLADVSADRRQRYEEEKAMRSRLGIGENVKAEDLKRAASGDTTGLSSEVMSVYNAQLAKGQTNEQIANTADEYLAGRSSGRYMKDAEYANESKIFAQLSASQAAFREQQAEAGVAEEDIAPPDLVAGKDPTRRLEAEMKRAQAQGRESTARFAANFDKLGIDPSLAGANLTGAQKEETIAKLQDLYREQLQQEGKMNEQQIEQSVTTFGDTIRKAENLAVVNTKRQGYTLGHALRHEDAHAETDRLSSQDQEEIFNELVPEEQEQIIADVSKQWGYDKLPEQEKRRRSIEEYLTEGMANFGRRDAVGPTLNTDLALAMKRRGVQFKGHQEKMLGEQSAEADVLRGGSDSSIGSEDIVSAIPEKDQTDLMNKLYSTAEQEQIASSLVQAGVLAQGLAKQKGEVTKAFFTEVAKRNRNETTSTQLPDDMFDKASIGMKELGAQFNETSAPSVDLSAQRDQLESAFRNSETALAQTEQEIRQKFQDLQSRHNVSSAALNNLGDNLVQKEMRELGIEEKELEEFRQLSERRNQQREQLDQSKNKLRSVLSGQLGVQPQESALKQYVEKQRELISRWEGVDRKSYEKDAERQRDAWLAVYKDLEEAQPAKMKVEQKVQKVIREAKGKNQNLTNEQLDEKRAEFFEEIAEGQEQSEAA